MHSIPGVICTGKEGITGKVLNVLLVPSSAELCVPADMSAKMSRLPAQRIHETSMESTMPEPYCPRRAEKPDTPENESLNMLIIRPELPVVHTIVAVISLGHHVLGLDHHLRFALLVPV